MYKEEIITDRVRAEALTVNAHLWVRNEAGYPLVASKNDVAALWGTVDFFACSHPTPRTIPPITVKLLIGANAYACIEESGRKTDILLSHGKGAPASLREYAADQRQRAKKLTELAELAERAAKVLESVE